MVHLQSMCWVRGWDFEGGAAAASAAPAQRAADTGLMLRACLLMERHSSPEWSALRYKYRVVNNLGACENNNGT